MFKKLDKRIKENENIVILRHANPDGDAAGSSFALKELIKTNYPGKNVKVMSQETNKFINNFFPKPDRYNKIFIEDSLIIVTDTANVERIDSPENFSSWDKSIKIDHHPNNDKYGNLQIVDTKYSSTCELITHIADELKWEITKKAATYLYIGFITDTGRFQYSSTTPDTMRRAAILLEKKINLNEIFSKLYNRNLKEVRFNATVQLKMKVENNVSFFLMPKNLDKKMGIPFSTASSSVYLLMGNKEVKYGLFASFDKDKKIYRISLRSKARPVNKVCEKFSGGGHSHACGIKVETKKQVMEVLEELKKINEK